MPAISSRPCRVPSSPHGPCSSGKTTSTSPSVRGTSPGSCTTSSPCSEVRSATSGAGRVDLRQPARGDPEAARGRTTRAPSDRRRRCRPGRRRSASGSRDAITSAAVRQRDPVLAGAAAEDDGDTGAAVDGLGWWPGAGSEGGSEVLIGQTLAARDNVRHAATLARSCPAPRVAVQAGRPPHEPDQPLNAPLVPASVYVAGGEREYGRYGNPTWEAFEQALGALEGGRCLAYASGLAAVATVLDLVADGETVVAPRHAYLGTLHQLGELERRGRVVVRQVDIADTAPVVDGARRRRAAVGRVADQPGARGRRPPGAVRRPRTRRARASWSTTRSRPRCGSARSTSAPTSSCTRRPSTCPATPTCARRGGHPRRRRRGGRWTSSRRTHRCGARCAGGLARPARPAHAGAAGRPGRGQRAGRWRAGSASTRRSTASATPGFGGIVAIELAGGAIAADLVCRSTRLWVHATSLGGVESTLERRRRWAGEPDTIPEEPGPAVGGLSRTSRTCGATSRMRSAASLPSRSERPASFTGYPEKRSRTQRNDSGFAHLSLGTQ